MIDERFYVNVKELMEYPRPTRKKVESMDQSENIDELGIISMGYRVC